MITGTGRSVLIGSFVALLLGLLLGYGVLLATGAAGLLLVAVSLLQVRSPMDLTVGRQVEPQRVAVTDIAFAELTVKNEQPQRSPSVEAFDVVGPGGIRTTLPALEPGASHTSRYRLPTDRRGLIDVGPLTISRTDPFGLVKSDTPHGDIRHLWVHPRRHALVPLPAALSRSFEGPTSDTAPRGTVTFHAIREYEFGDDLRHVHWPATAHTGDLMVRDFIDTSQPDLTVVLDVAAHALSPDDFEQAVEIAASLLVTTASQQFPLRYVSSAGDHVETSSNGDESVRYLDHLTMTEQSDTASLTIVDRVLASHRRGHAAVIITGPLDGAGTLGLQGLTRRFNTTVVVSIGATSVPIPGATVMLVSSSADFAGRWNRGGNW